MPTLDEIGNVETGGQVNDIPVSAPEESIGIQANEPNRMQEMMKKILTAETGPGSIEDYIDHPLNFMKSKGFSQVLRGLTGVFGSLSLAVIDIALGSLQFSKERKGAVMNDVHGGPSIPN